MEKILIFATMIIIVVSCGSQNNKMEKDISLGIKNLEVTPLSASIRALEVVDDKTVWFAGSEGQYGFTEDGGVSWTIDSIKTDTITPHFRSIAITDEAVFLLSIASPALLYKSIDKGKNWKIVYREGHPAAFYDAMAFWNEEEGIAMGDPTEGCLSIIITKDGGDNWSKLSCEILPAAAEGEAAFAASNSNIALYGNHAWIVSGGKKARCFHSSDKGESWKVFDTPIVEGGQMTGIFTIDFWDEKTGIIFGGNWEDKENNSKNKAITRDGGRNWQLIAEGQYPGFRSCVQYLPDGGGKQIMAVGIPGTSYSNDEGQSWISLNDESFYTLRFGKKRTTAWLAGDKKIARIVWED